MQRKKFLILVDLLKKTDYNSKISEIESKIPSISGLATNSAADYNKFTANSLTR